MALEMRRPISVKRQHPAEPMIPDVSTMFNRYVVFVKRKEQIINNFQKSGFSAMTRTIC